MHSSDGPKPSTFQTHFLHFEFGKKKNVISKIFSPQILRGRLLLVVMSMVLKTGTVKEPEKYLIIGFMIGPRSDRWSNR